MATVVLLGNYFLYDYILKCTLPIKWQFFKKSITFLHLYYLTLSLKINIRHSLSTAEKHSGVLLRGATEMRSLFETVCVNHIEQKQSTLTTLCLKCKSRNINYAYTRLNSCIKQM